MSRCSVVWSARAEGDPTLDGREGRPRQISAVGQDTADTEKDLLRGEEAHQEVSVAQDLYP